MKTDKAEGTHSGRQSLATVPTFNSKDAISSPEDELQAHSSTSYRETSDNESSKIQASIM